MSKAATLPDVIDEIAAERDTLYRRLADLSPERVWQRPTRTDGGRWSIGENLDHIRRNLKFMRLILVFAAAIERPLARLRRKRPYAAMIENVFDGRLAGMKAPPGTRPRDRRGDPIPVAELRQGLDRELAKLRALCEGMHADVAGHVKIWDPYLGTVNLYQVVIVLRDHERHHFRFVRHLLERPPWGEEAKVPA